MNTIRELAKLRESQWVERHGEHEYEQHDLIAEAEEEIADAWNYTNAELRINGQLIFAALELKGVLHDLEKVWTRLQRIREHKRTWRRQ